MEKLVQDIRYAVRSLLASPGFTIIAALTLALGIGANTAIFSVLNAVLLKPLPYGHPEQLVRVTHFYPSLNSLRASVSVPGYRDYRERTDLFDKFAVETGGNMNLTGAGEPERVNVSRVSQDFFGTYEIAPMIGRTLRPDEFEEGHNHVVVLGYNFWKTKLGAEPNVVGKTIQLNGETYEIAGVMPATFRDFYNRAAQLWTPVVFRPADFSDSRRTNEFLNVTARLKPGVTLERAQAALTDLATRLKQEYTNSYARDWTLQVTTLNEEATGALRPALIMLISAVGLVLLIACANVANLQLARTAGRSREIAVRVALGASPARLLRQLLTESVLLSLVGGAVGLLLALWGVPALLSLNPPNLPPASEVGIDGTVLAFAALVSILTGLLFGLAPALQVIKDDLQDTLKDGSRGAAGTRGSNALRRGLVVSTVALALTLLAGAGLLVRSFARITGVTPGFDADHVLVFNLSLPAVKYANDTARADVYARVLASIRATPGVVAAGGTSNVPLDGNWSTASFNVEGYQRPANAPMPWGDVRIASSGYFEALKTPLLKGRTFTDEDRMGAPGVVVVDEEMVRRYWPSTDPIGKRITFNDLTDSNITWFTVVGVVGHMKSEALDADARVQYYFPLAQAPRPFLGVVVRTQQDPIEAVPAIRNAVRQVDADLPLANVNTAQGLIDGTLGPRRFSMLLLGLFAGVALLLASIGLYGVMSYMVTQRVRELGVRVALGANTREVLGLVLGQGVRLAAAGVAIGLVASFALTRLMKRMLFSVSATDPITFIAISVLLVGVALLASYIPARRATRVDPIVALRAE